MAQRTVDHRNAAFWDTLCGWDMAREAGITGESEDDLHRFDELYLGFYPYLERYVPQTLEGTKVLEVGLGFGTLGQLLASRGGEYHGVDIAAEPVAVMKRRLAWLGQPEDHAQQASALDLPFEDETFDYVYSIGCLHHTGNLQKSIQEVLRVLRRGGRAVVMLYYRHSLRRLAYGLRSVVRRGQSPDEKLRAMYDAHESGEPAPHTDFVSRAEAKHLFRDFARICIEVQNFDNFHFGIRREWFLSNIARVVGLDVYIVADKGS